MWVSHKIDATGGEDLKDEQKEEAREGEKRTRDAEHGSNGEASHVCSVYAHID